MFKNDDLVAEPGTKFAYTTHGLTLASAVLEKAAGEDYPTLAKRLFFDLGLRNTHLDVNQKIIAGRASYYHRNDKKVLENCPEVDCSYKWAGGGLLSNVSDLLVFANAILYSSQNDTSDSLITHETMRKFLTPQIEVEKNVRAALGWMIVEGKDLKSADDKRSTGGFFYHTGGAVGASSVLLVRPAKETRKESPSGVCVAILCNLQETSVLSLAHQIEEIFRK
ncbi:unnamed protein product [Caenorhabditis auriculariae]|uniref:Beta-lactamase-related domain-containing protein n=1 Tax=Caenorhabditis auriculariae TaxID=2777116 RepID=A0A8S1HSJ2_9PELO|nr:unnamed protein product [Caenorhabditis auriculariae]